MSCPAGVSWGKINTNDGTGDNIPVSPYIMSPYLPLFFSPAVSHFWGALQFGNARLTDRRAGRRWLFCREECKQRDSNHAKDHNVLGAILPVHPVRHGLRRHDCHREPMGKA